MKKNKRKIIYTVSLAICLILISFVIPIVINESYKKGEGYITVWSGADVLSFYGALIGAIGTIILGIVAWRQNERLLRLEENNFAAENACSAIVKNVMVRKINQNACNLNLHVEQIVATEESMLIDYCSSIEFGFELEMLNNIPVLVYISDLLVFSNSGHKNGQFSVLSAKGLKCEYSRIAVGKDYCAFNCTILLTKNEKDKLVKSIQCEGSKMLMEISFCIVTDNMIASNYKCRVKLKSAESDNNSNINFNIDDGNSPLCFWYGNKVIDKEEICIKEIMEDKYNG